MLNEGPRILADWLRDHATYGVDVLSPDVPRDDGDDAPPLVGQRVYDETRHAETARGDASRQLVEDGAVLQVRWGQGVSIDPTVKLGENDSRWRVAANPYLIVTASIAENDTADGTAALYYLCRAALDSALRLFDASAVDDRTRNKVRLELASGDVQLRGVVRPENDTVLTAAFALPVRVVMVAA